MSFQLLSRSWFCGIDGFRPRANPRAATAAAAPVHSFDAMTNLVVENDTYNDGGKKIKKGIKKIFLL